MSGSIPRGFTIRETIAIIICIAIMLVVLVPVLFTPPRRVKAKMLKDSSQIRGIHQSWLVFSRNFDGIYPTPGLINRLADPATNQQTPGRGPEDVEANTTANLYSACIMNNYISPDLLISPVERSPHVKARGDSYNWEDLNVANDVYWDTGFKAELHGISNVSYAHMPLVGVAMLKQWRESCDSSWPILGNRGPLHGVADPNSITNKFYKPNNSWNGNICYNDGHVDFTDSFFRRTGNESLGYQLLQDNLFSWDTPNGYDAMITFTKAIVDGKPVIEHD